mmetsp:Transcript_29190/g.56419  ORF Transcript_29190/g.56419 Transcript_29190/m.56419 type:complete len:138 (-) Transcript_29190:5757-6170(-)
MCSSAQLRWKLRVLAPRLGPEIPERIAEHGEEGGQGQQPRPPGDSDADPQDQERGCDQEREAGEELVAHGEHSHGGGGKDPGDGGESEGHNPGPPPKLFHQSMICSIVFQRLYHLTASSNRFAFECAASEPISTSRP